MQSTSSPVPVLTATGVAKPLAVPSTCLLPKAQTVCGPVAVLRPVLEEYDSIYFCEIWPDLRRIKGKEPQKD